MSNKEPNKKRKNDQYILRLYVTGASPNSLRAIANTKSFCDEFIKDGYELEVIDVYQNPVIAKEENIIALPLLIKKYPLPEKRLIGDMSDMERVKKGIGITNTDSK